MNNISFGKTVLFRIFKLFTKANDSDEAIRLLKLTNSLDISKPNCPSLNELTFKIDSPTQIIESKNLAVLLCLGILNGTYDISRTSIRDNL